ncbi:MAG: glycosyltransferase family 4 protein [Glaciimonas sp.]|nr:glycosyltransferase family 4 protein [Glaciimonas sp.]
MEKYILQYGSLAGWPYRVAEGLRKAGYKSLNVIQENSDVADLDRQLPHHRALANRSDGKLTKLIKRVQFLGEVAEQCSLVHYHGGVILRSHSHHLIEGRLLAKKQIPMIMSFGGGDARIVSEARAKNPYFFRQPDGPRDEQIRAYLKSISRYIRHVATDCEMMSYVEPYFEKCHIFRQPVNLQAIQFTEPRIDRPPVILHTPTESWVKGTDYIIAAVEKLQAEGCKFEFSLKRQLTQTQMYEEIMACDVYIDELLCGSHGVTAVETMAAGKPTMTYIRPDLVSKYPTDMPLVNTNPDTIYDKLKELICEPDLRADLSYRSRRYVEKYHDVDIVVGDLIDTYKEIGFQSD